jgi:hypothetical protein
MKNYPAKIQRERDTNKFFTLATVCILIGMVFVGWKYFSLKSSELDINGTNSGNLETPNPSETPLSSSEPLEINFTETGMIFDENRITGAKEWTFLYEKPGNLILTVKLNFNSNSICVLDAGTQICDMKSFDWSKYDTDTYFDLEGYRQGGEVTVIKLTLHRF